MWWCKICSGTLSCTVSVLQTVTDININFHWHVSGDTRLYCLLFHTSCFHPSLVFYAWQDIILTTHSFLIYSQTGKFVLFSRETLAIELLSFAVRNRLVWWSDISNIKLCLKNLWSLTWPKRNDKLSWWQFEIIG